jgi:hypothetical protein
MVSHRSSGVLVHVSALAGALVLAALLHWLAADYRAGGILGTLQGALSFLFVIPYVVAAVLGPGPHNPSSVVFFVALLLESYALVVLVLSLLRLLRKRRSLRHA